MFFHDGKSLDSDNVLACKKQTSESNYGLYYWDDPKWDNIDYTFPTTQGFGGRMKRSPEDGRIVYMTGPDISGEIRVWSLDVVHSIMYGFKPELVTEQEVIDWFYHNEAEY